MYVMMKSSSCHFSLRSLFQFVMLFTFIINDYYNITAYIFFINRLIYLLVLIYSLYVCLSVCWYVRTTHCITTSLNFINITPDHSPSCCLKSRQ